MTAIYNASTQEIQLEDGTTPPGPYNLTYYARYYQTANNPTAGTVSTTATFTLTYQ